MQTIREQFSYFVDRDPSWSEQIISVMTDHFDERYEWCCDYWDEDEFDHAMDYPLNHLFCSDGFDFRCGVFDDNSDTMLCIAEASYLDEIGYSTPQQVIEKIRNTDWDDIPESLRPRLRRRPEEIRVPLRLTKNTTNWKDEGF